MSAEPILEILYDHYNEHCGYYNEEIQESFEKLKQLPFEEGDKILSAAIVLCAAYEKAGFMAGIKYGYRLSKELDIP